MLSRHHAASAWSTAGHSGLVVHGFDAHQPRLPTWPHPLDLAFPQWVWPLVGAIFVPWTTLAYLIVFPGGVVGQDWLWLGLGLLIDLGAHFGGGYRNRDRIPRYRR